MSLLGGCASPPPVAQPPCSNIASCTLECRAGSAEGCFLAGYRFEGGVETAQDLQRAEALYEESCGAGFQAACLGWMRLLSTSEEDTRRAKAAALGRTACDAGYGEGCLRAGLLGADAGPALISRGVAILRRKCGELADDPSCTILANLAFSGALGSADLEVAAAAYVRSCEGGDPHACVRVAELLEERHPDVERVASRSSDEYFHAACGLGLLRACTEHWTRQLETQRGPIGEDVRSRLSALCEIGEADACAVLAKLRFLDGEADRGAYGESRDLYERACTLKNGSACNSFGIMIGAGLGGARNIDLAHEVYRTGCQLGEEEACMNAAWMEAQGLVDAGDPERGLARLQTACARGDGESCYRSGQVLFLAGDKERATTLTERACRLNEADGCTALAVWLLDGQGPETGGARALELATYACQSRSGGGCMLAGKLHESGVGTRIDPQLAKSFFHRACAYRSAEGCEALARRVEGKLAAEFWVVGKTLRGRACREGSASDCVTVGVYLHRGLGGEVAIDTAALFYADGCESGQADGCLYAGQLLATGSGVEVSRDRASVFFRRGCELGNNDACAWEGLSYHLGDGAEKDIERAVEIYERTCAAGSGFGCVGMGNVYEHGDGRPRSGEKAREYYDKACAAGESRYCR